MIEERLRVRGRFSCDEYAGHRSGDWEGDEDE